MFALAAVPELFTAAPISAAAQEGSASRTALTIYNIYNDGRELVEDRHTLRLEEGIQTTPVSGTCPRGWIPRA